MANGADSPPPCYVLVRKLSMDEISRLSLSPLSITYKCGRCKQRVYYGPKCASCGASFHRNCAALRKKCCEIELVSERGPRSDCPRCLAVVEFGPQCVICRAKYHHFCVGPLDQCCQLSLCERTKVARKCGRCEHSVDLGPRCPVCGAVFHAGCVGAGFECCGVGLGGDSEAYKCRKCNRKLALASAMCPFCGRLSHQRCLKSLRNCCGREVALEIYLIPNFKYTLQYFRYHEKRKDAFRKIEIMGMTRTLRSSTSKGLEDAPQRLFLDLECAPKRTKKKPLQTTSVSSQTSNITEIITAEEIKTELEPEEVHLPDSPILEREEVFYSPVPSSSLMEANPESDESLRNLFDFLYSMVRKFPPPLQAQVKIDLFKTVTEAETKWQAQKIQNSFL